MYLEFWKRKNAYLAWWWDVMDYEELVRLRAPPPIVRARARAHALSLSLIAVSVCLRRAGRKRNGPSGTARRFA